MLAVRPDVLLMVDLGQVFIDNGESTIQMPLKAFREATRSLSSATLMVERFPRFFTLAETEAEAEERLRNARYRP